MMVSFAESIELAARLPQDQREKAINLLQARFGESEERADL